MSSHPTAFVSYSWDDDDHRHWVRELVTRLRADGIDARSDHWHAAPGDQLTEFMEREIRQNSHVVIICTPNYKKRSDGRLGGVGYEGDIMTAEVFNQGNHRKFIPVLARGNWKTNAAPSWLAGKLYIDLSTPEKLAKNYSDLFATLAGTRSAAPPLGPLTPAPTATSFPATASKPKLAAPPPVVPTDGTIKITGVILDEVTQPKMDGTKGSALYKIPFRLSRQPSPEWAKLFVSTWNMPPRFTSMHRPGIARVTGDKIILDGTTMEEVQQYHKETLQLCVAEANQKEEQWRAKVARQQQANQQRAQSLRTSIEEEARKISFD